MRLFVDDVRPCPVGWIVARTVSEAKALLATGRVESASLDHDMGACADCRLEGRDVGDMRTDESTFYRWCPHAEDGTALVRWMIETGHWPKSKPHVHSFNPTGAKRMRELIEAHFEALS